jgi:hypothetical protein
LDLHALARRQLDSGRHPAILTDVPRAIAKARPRAGLFS